MTIFKPLCVFILLLSSESLYALTSVIPSPRLTARSTHATASAAAWSERKRFNLSYRRLDQDSESAGATVDEDTQDILATSIFHHANNVTIEAGLSLVSGEDKDFSPDDTADYEERNTTFNLGFQLKDKPVTIGIQHQSFNTLEKDPSSGRDEFDQNNIELSVGWKTTSELYFMAGIRQEDIDDNGFDDEDDAFLFGVGQYAPEALSWELSFDYENEESRKEKDVLALLFYQQDNLQHIFSLNWIDFSSPADFEYYYLYYGVDITKGNLYYLPSIYFIRSNSAQDLETLGYGFEIGHRTEARTIFANLFLSEGELDSSPIREDQTLSLTVGANWTY